MFVSSVFRSRKISVLSAFLALLLVASLVAQKTPKPSPPKYDLHTEVKIKGTIEEVKLPPKGSEKEIVHLLVKNGTDSVDVYLCPKSFFDDMGMDFSKGDGITLTRLESEIGRSGIRPRARSGERKQHLRPPRRERRPGLELTTLEKSQR